MIRATTPTHIFSLPFETKLLKKIIISYGQYGCEVLKKETNDKENNVMIDDAYEEVLSVDRVNSLIDEKINTLNATGVAY